MKRARKSKRLVDFDHPPINEVVYGVRFAPLKAWLLPHVGLFWQQVRADYPRCEHAAPIGDPIGDSDITDPATGLPVPRVWLISSNNDRLIQLQPGRFLFNWRSRDEAGPYPRYEALSETFFKLWREFCAFVDEQKLGDIEVRGYELTYLNHISEPQGCVFPNQTDKVLTDMTWRYDRSRFLQSPSIVSWQAAFPFENDSGVLVVKSTPAKRNKDDVSIIILDLTARTQSLQAPIAEPKQWFARAREWIVRGFVDLTTEEAQRDLWGKK